ncbi:MAG TPA: hypothetical protein VKM55_12050 [Candidatus Lokiarchaeia archaeon]|nr:hypothetical protein [Candidatus Lokiarchaeia archaeon]
MIGATATAQISAMIAHAKDNFNGFSNISMITKNLGTAKVQLIAYLRHLPEIGLALGRRISKKRRC